MKFLKKNIILILGFTLPAAMVLFVAAGVYLPSLFAHPQYNFLYEASDIYYGEAYGVENGRLVDKSGVDIFNYGYDFGDESLFGDGKTSSQTNTSKKLFLHDVTQNSSREITFEEASNFELDPEVKSPDGFEVVKPEGDYPSSLLFGAFGASSSYGAMYIKGNGVSKKLNLDMASSYGRFHFLGWVKSNVE